LITLYFKLKNDNMKNKLFLFASCLIFAVSCKKATEDVISTDAGVVAAIAASNVPTPVLNSFATRFTTATQVEWFSVSSSSSSSREYEVEYNHLSQRHNSRFDNNGVEKRHSISCTDGPVPQSVLTAFRSTHPTDIVYEWKLRNDGTWKAHYLRGTVKWEATYTAAAVLVKEEIS
jgi:hypothetical protein